MEKLIRRLLAFFLLILFLFPQIEKGFHDFQHRNDFHCKAYEHHLHQQSHTCSLCSFVPPLTNIPFQQVPLLSVFTLPMVILTKNEPIVFSSREYFISLRAPPAVF